MHEIKISVEDKNLETVLNVLDNLDIGLISEIKTTDKESIHTSDESNKTKVTANGYPSASNPRLMDADEKRKKLFWFAFITLIVLSIAFIYFEVYDQTHVPSLLRFILATYWLYSFIGVIISKRGNDYWVSKIYFNITR